MSAVVGRRKRRGASKRISITQHYNTTLNINTSSQQLSTGTSPKATKKTYLLSSEYAGSGTAGAGTLLYLIAKTMFSRPVQLTRGRGASSARAFSASQKAAASASAASSHGVSPWGKPTQKSKDSIIRIPVEAKLPAHAQVLVAGAGLIGNSVAYHLVQNGWSDVVIIDRGNIADGTSKYGSGMLGLFRPTHERKIVQDCIELYRNLQQKVWPSSSCDKFRVEAKYFIKYNG